MNDHFFNGVFVTLAVEAAVYFVYDTRRVLRKQKAQREAAAKQATEIHAALAANGIEIPYSVIAKSMS